MKKLYILFIVQFLFVFSNAQVVVENPDVSQGVLVRITPPLSSYVPNPAEIHDIVRDENGIIGGPLNIENRFHNRPFNPNALPLGKDLIRQEEQGKGQRVMQINMNQTAQGNTSVSPADPSLCVGPNHVIQMINGSSGAYFVIYNKSGAVVQAQTYMDAISGIAGLGDPIALYDQFADRYYMTEFANVGNRLIVMVSQTSNPLGSWYVYSFNTPEFPDYPKYAIWPQGLICTSNESTNKVYAMNRTAMLAGTPTTTLISFSIPGSPSVGFQAAAPVNLAGTTLPPSGTNPLVMRMTDDAWGTGLNDELQMWSLNLNFTTPASSTMSQMPSLLTAPFVSHLCGYTTLSCIRQPGTTRLDPLREIIMNRIYYRTFSSHQSIVLAHAVDATGATNLDQAGVRWYELRRTGTGPWSIYQQSTYAPDTASRWMPSIGIDNGGNIGLVYNLSSKLAFPSIRITGRLAGDPLGVMTQTEQSIIAGASNHTNNRWGDYNDLGIDPSDDATFWITGMFMPASGGWSTRVASFNLGIAPLPLDFNGLLVNAVENTIQISWKTLNEIDMQAMQIERSVLGDFSDKEIINIQKAQNKLENNYFFEDDKVQRGIVYYYRIVAKGLDNDIFSETKSALLSDISKIDIYPNPLVDENLFIKYEHKLLGQNLSFKIYNSVGKIEFTKDLNPHEQVNTIDLKGLSSGLYVIKVYKNQNEIYTGKIIKN